MGTYLLALGGKEAQSEYFGVDIIDKANLKPLGRSHVNAMLFIRLGVPLAPIMSFQGQIDMVLVILQIGLDEHLHARLSEEVETSLQHVFHTIDTTTWNRFCDVLCTGLCSKIRAAFLQVRALKVFPVTTERDWVFRRFVASSFFFNCDVVDRSAFENTTSLMREFADEIRKLPLLDGEMKDWADVASRLEILDFAVGSPHQGVQELCTELASFISRNPDILLASLDRIRAKDVAQRIRLKQVYSAPELFAFSQSGNLLQYDLLP